MNLARQIFRAIEALTGTGTTLVVPPKPEAQAPDGPDDPNDSEKDAPRKRVVAAGQISQPWHVGAFAPASITLPGVRAGDAIIVAGVYWGDLRRGARTAPTDRNGRLVAAIDQGPTIVGAAKPPVFAQIYHELDAAPGTHVIVPPHLGGVAGDGTLYVLQVRGLARSGSLRAIGHSRIVSMAIRDVSVMLGAGAAEPGDLIVAIGGNDNTTCLDSAGFTHPPPGWIAAGVQNNAAENVPSEICYRVATEAGRHPVSWSWVDPTVNVAVAAIAAFR